MNSVDLSLRNVIHLQPQLFDNFFRQFTPITTLGGFWSGEKIITNDDTHGLSYAPSVVEVTPDGDLIMLTPQL